MGISSDAVAVLAFAWTLLVALLAFVWRAATTATSHSHRISQLEKDQGAFASAVVRLTKVVQKLETRLTVNEALDSVEESKRQSRPSRGGMTGNDTTP